MYHAYGGVQTYSISVFRVNSDVTALNLNISEFRTQFALAYSDVAFPVVVNSCADVVAKGLNPAIDANNDCYVDLADFVMMGQSWLECSNPQDPTLRRSKISTPAAEEGEKSLKSSGTTSVRTQARGFHTAIV